MFMRLDGDRSTRRRPGALAAPRREGAFDAVDVRIERHGREHESIVEIDTLVDHATSSANCWSWTDQDTMVNHTVGRPWQKRLQRDLNRKYLMISRRFAHR